MTRRSVRRLETPEAFKVTVECGRFDVVVEELPGRPEYVVMRRWVSGVNGAKGTWKRKAIGTMALRDARGAVLDAARTAARDAASKWYVEQTGEHAAVAPVAVQKPLTVGETYAKISDDETGKYPFASAFRTELRNALAIAATVWGADTAWASIGSDEWTKLIRRRVSDLVARKKSGIRTTEITVSRINTALIWLRTKKLIAANDAHPDPTWREDLLKFWKGLVGQQHDPVPARPRYTVEQSRALIGAAWDVDPRSGLLLALGAELRLGQVRRAMRSHLDLGAGERGTFTVQGSGDKLGETIELTVGQRAAALRAIDRDRGYLRALEATYREDATSDYPLFAGGKLFGRKSGHPYVRGSDPDSTAPMSRSTISKRWVLIEFMAGVAHIDFRGAYGIRRTGVDAALAEHITEQGLKSWGGWSTPDVPRRVYADSQNKEGRREAATLRARFRGEAT